MSSNNTKPRKRKGSGAGDKRGGGSSSARNASDTPDETEELSANETPKKPRKSGKTKSGEVPETTAGKRKRKAPEKPPGFVELVRQYLGQVGRLVVRSAAFGIWLGLLFILVLIYYARDLPSTDKLYGGATSPRLLLLDRNGQSIATLGEYHGEPLTYKDFPPNLVHAVLATEDRRFFHHFGIDVVGIMRAIYTNMRAGRMVQGGSTITQQLAKVAFLSPDRKLKRKVQEAMLAMWLEYTFSKEEILAMYLNRVYLGVGTYGVDAAAHQYFGKKVGELNLYESAILAGLLKAPTRYSPYNNPELALARMQQVLTNMVAAGYISEKEAKARPVTLAHDEAQMHNRARYFVDWIVNQMPEYINVPEDENSLEIQTTLDMKIQDAAEEALHKNLKKQQGAVVSLTPQGAVLAMVGGRDYQESQFNRTVLSRRQPGSSFKLFVYLAGFESGYHPDDVMRDQPVTISTASGPWTPKNFHKEFLGDMPLQDAFALSINTIAVQLSEAIGREKPVEMARRLGIESPLPVVPSMALGADEVTLLEMTQAYAHIAAGGLRVRAYGIQSIKAGSGKVLYERGAEEAKQPRVLAEQTVHDMNRLLKAVIERGTGTKARLAKREAAGKTGTTQDSKDAWFIGFTPQIVTGVWTGYDDNRPMGKTTTGGTLPTLIFHDVMEKAHEGLPAEEIPTQGGVLDGVMQWLGAGQDTPQDNEAPPADTTPEDASASGADTPVPTTPVPAISIPAVAVPHPVSPYQEQENAAHRPSPAGALSPDEAQIEQQIERRNKGRGTVWNRLWWPDKGEDVESKIKEMPAQDQPWKNPPASMQPSDEQDAPEDNGNAPEDEETSEPQPAPAPDPPQPAAKKHNNVIDKTLRTLNPMRYLPRIPNPF